MKKILGIVATIAVIIGLFAYSNRQSINNNDSTTEPIAAAKQSLTKSREDATNAAKETAKTSWEEERG